MLINSKTHLVSKNYDRKCLTEFLDSKKLGPTKIATVTDLHFPLFLSFSLFFLYSSPYLHTALSLSLMSLSLFMSHSFFLSLSLVQSAWALAHSLVGELLASCKKHLSRYSSATSCHLE